MELNDYQREASKTAIYPEKHQIMYPVLGLIGEAGELANKVKKVYRDNNGVFNNNNTLELAQELGDVLWYVAALAADLGFTLDMIAVLNLEKLTARKDKGTLQGSGDNR